ADLGRAARRLSCLLRVEGARLPALRAADPACGRPLDPADDRRDAAADAVLPRARATAGAAADDRAEELPHSGHRRGRARRLAPDLLRDARQLLVRPVLQG